MTSNRHKWDDRGFTRKPPVYLDTLMDNLKEGYIDTEGPYDSDDNETKVILNKKKPMKKVINMATGGLMSKPPYIRNEEEKDTGITPYDVSTPESARKGMPSRLLSKERTRFRTGDGVKPLLPEDIPELEQHEIEPGDVAKLNKIETKEYIILKKGKELDLNTPEQNKKLKKLEQKKNQAALGGYMDNFQIAEEEPLSRQKIALGGRAALEEKYDRRKDYRAYAEGDEVIAEEEIVEEPLMAPVGMEEPLIEDEIAADDLAMEEDVAMEDAESVLDTSMLSEEEEVVVDAAIEMYPELEAILPKMVATEFTEDELVEGPGTGTSDSIPALLSDGEFVFTAKAVKNIGIDKLRKMMAQAEEAYDAGMVNQEETAELAVDETIV